MKNHDDVFSSSGITSTPRAFIYIAMMICIFISSSLFAGDIYVNGDQAVYGDGTISNPYKSISSAITAAQSCTTATTIHIKGRYNGQYYNQNLSISGFDYPLTLKRWAVDNYELIIKGTGNTVSTISIGANNATITITGATISRASDPPTQSNLEGGGISINSSDVVIDNCVIHHCRARKGGGIYANNSTVQINNTKMFNNTGVNYSGVFSYGGAIYGNYSNMSMSKSILYDNAGEISGQSVDCDETIYIYGADLNCDATTIIHDSPLGVVVGGPTGNENATFLNCIIYQPYWNFVDPVYEFCCAYNTQFSGFGGLGNIIADPLFVDQNNGDFSLSKGSPCIGAGFLDAYCDYNGDPGNQDLISPHQETQDIGAIPYDGDRFITYVFEDDAQGNWMCFPVLDDLSYVTIDSVSYRADNMRAFFYDYEGTPSDMNQVQFRWYDPSNVFGTNIHYPDDVIEWHLMAGQNSDEWFLGYKAIFYSPSEMQRIHGYHIPLDQYVQVPVHSVENWIGYFLPETQTPEAAFGSYLDELYYIQHKDWTLARTMIKRGAPWVAIGDTITLSYGDMVAVKRFTTSIGQFQWTRGFHTKEYVREVPEYFEFVKEPEYTAVFVQLDSLTTAKEIAIMSEDECYGAAVVNGETVMIPAFISSLPEGSELELVAWDGVKSSPDAIPLKLFDPANDTFIQCSSFIKDKSDYFLIKTGSSIQDTDTPVTLGLRVTNYPNPFNPSTTISYSVPTDGEVSLTIYNSRGQLVNTLVSKHMNKGNYQVVWQGRDTSGRSVASGLYITRLVTGGKSIINKMLLMK